VLLAEGDTLLQGMTDSLIYVGRCCGMEMNVDETKVIRISRQPSLIHIMIYEHNWKIFNISAIWVI